MIQLDVVMSSAKRAINLTQLEQEPQLRTQYDNVFKQKVQPNMFSKVPLESYNFPFQGKVEFKNVFMSYNKHKKPVLSGVSFIIQPGKKVAFVGRTGAGKSSILLALYRMFEITNQQQTFASSQNILHTNFQQLFQSKNKTQQNQPELNCSNIFSDREQDINLETNREGFSNLETNREGFINQEINHEGIIHQETNREGFIKIDDHSISNIGIQTLRDGFSIIPQIPFIFTGTIRMNIDPFQKYTDQEIWKVIEEIELEQKVKSFPNGLSTEISNSNESFTVGQKQLICLGRALLKKSKILVLDEITSNCDAQTEDIIIKLIKKFFVGSTIITIAHRLHTIADYDEVIVLDQGQISEQGSPDDLLQLENGIFANMVKCSGDKASKQIRSLTRRKKILLQINQNFDQQNEDSKLN